MIVHSNSAKRRGENGSGRQGSEGSLGEASAPLIAVLWRFVSSSGGGTVVKEKLNIHVVNLRGPPDLDDEIRAWLTESCLATRRRLALRRWPRLTRLRQQGRGPARAPSAPPGVASTTPLDDYIGCQISAA
jgi:hypothetical protein